MNVLSESINLFYFPLNVMIVDDDIDYLSLLQQQLKNVTVSIYNSPLEAMKNIEPININIRYFLENNFSRINDLSYKSIENFVKNYGNKQGVLISDYNMPNINGVDLLSKYSDTDLIKILLTNVYTINEAVNALNKKLINYYLPKEKTNILLNVIREHQKILFQNITKDILSFLDVDSLKFLFDKRYIYIFNNICQKHNIRKYYILNSYGSYYLENETDKFIFSIYNPTDLLEVAKEVPENKKYNVEQGDLIPSYFLNEATEYKLIKAQKYGNYSYCIEKII
ncbi:MAG TPA: hypothetical protein PKD00_02530 [Burkholderiales bacterium]|nr:hypothetical protein [Burkholderiales bacterium]